MNFTDDEIESIMHDADRYDDFRYGIGPESARRLLDAASALRPVPQWISYDKQPPTYDDADVAGEVVWMDHGELFLERFDARSPGEYWMRCADVAALPKRP